MAQGIRSTVAEENVARVPAVRQWRQWAGEEPRRRHFEVMALDAADGIVIASEPGAELWIGFQESALGSDALRRVVEWIWR